MPSSGGHAAAFRSLLWAGMDQMIGVIGRCLAQVRMLCVTLQKKRSCAGTASSTTTLAGRLSSYVLKNLENMDEKDCCAAIVLVLCTEETHSDAESGSCSFPAFKTHFVIAKCVTSTYPSYDENKTTSAED